MPFMKPRPACPERQLDAAEETKVVAVEIAVVAVIPAMIVVIVMIPITVVVIPVTVMVIPIMVVVVVVVGSGWQRQRRNDRRHQQQKSRLHSRGLRRGSFGIKVPSEQRTR